MRTAATAVLWESWRLTRRRLVSIPALATLCAWLLTTNSASTLAFVVMLAASVAMALSLPLIGSGPGFPFSKAFSRPIQTSVLVVVPLVYVSVAAAAGYLVPAIALRVLTGAPFPLMPVAVLVGTLAVLVAGASWSTRTQPLGQSRPGQLS